jgi:hypothetical protein
MCVLSINIFLPNVEEAAVAWRKSECSVVEVDGRIFFQGCGTFAPDTDVVGESKEERRLEEGN